MPVRVATNRDGEFRAEISRATTSTLVVSKAGYAPEVVAIDARAAPQALQVRLYPGDQVTPGEYVIGARNRTPRLIAHLPITVGQSNVEPILLRLSEGSTVSGELVYEEVGGAPLTPPEFFVGTIPADPEGHIFTSGVEPLPNGRFEAPALVGALRFLPRRLAPGWWLKSVRIDGMEATEVVVPFGTATESRSDVRIVLSRTAPELTGRVTDASGRPVSGSGVLVFPTGAARWSGWPHLLSMVRADPDGRFVVNTLAPGEYWVAATDGLGARLDSGEWQLPEMLSALVAVSRRVTLAEAERTSLNLRASWIP